MADDADAVDTQQRGAAEGAVVVAGDDGVQRRLQFGAPGLAIGISHRFGQRPERQIRALRQEQHVAGADLHPPLPERPQPGDRTQ